MSDTENLALPCIEGPEAQFHVTHNESLRMLDALVQLAVLDRDLSAPPASPAEGARWIVGASPSGEWSARANHVASWLDGAWQFSEPRTGWIAYVIDEGVPVVWNGSAWADLFSTIAALQNLTRLGVGTTADATNPFAAKLNNALWVAKTTAEGGSGDLRYKLSKETAGDTLSLLFQTNFSGRAEVGLTGDDDFHFKVSPDGSAWLEAFTIDHTTGRIRFPITGGPRETLTAARTYYVRPDGDDANNGLSDTAGGAFATIQRAVDVVSGNLDIGVHQATIQLADGTYSESFVLRPYIGGTAPIIQGNSTNPNNVQISGNTGQYVVTNNNAAKWILKDFKITNAGAGGLILVQFGGAIDWSGINFGTTGTYQMHCAGAFARAVGNYTVSGNAKAHLVAGGYVSITGRTITFVGTPDCSGSGALAWFFVDRGGTLDAFGAASSGSATGKKWAQTMNGALFVAGGDPDTIFAGSVNGTAEIAALVK